jgi:outer membrane protein assembly factor BamA
MKKYCFLLLMLFPLFVTAQVITYDTIRVSPDDERNINRRQQQSRRTESVSITPQRKQITDESPATFDKSKLRFGADLGLSISRNYTRLGFGPQVGYQFNNYFMAGAGIKYYYTKAATTNYIIRNNLLGANLFGYLYPTRFITAFVQPELNYIRSVLTEKVNDNEELSRGIVPSLVVGAGLRLGRSHITLNYDLVQHANSPHPGGFYLGISAFF